MNPRVLRRFIFLMAFLTIGAFVFWDVLEDYVRREPGDYYTEVGSNRLVDGLYDEAMDNFDKALEEAPDHRGALMGRALVFIRTERYQDAVAELDYLVGYLNRTLEPDDRTGVGVLAAAYANRGVAYDYLGAYEKALESYVEALNVDEEVVEGPGVVHKILYGSERVSTVRDRARYIYEQLQKPEGERVMRIPELDARQRMHKP
jgi:tetratricopeptide (TPR) repeat protein